MPHWLWDGLSHERNKRQQIRKERRQPQEVRNETSRGKNVAKQSSLMWQSIHCTKIGGKPFKLVANSDQTIFSFVSRCKCQSRPSSFFLLFVSYFLTTYSQAAESLDANEAIESYTYTIAKKSPNREKFTKMQLLLLRTIISRNPAIKKMVRNSALVSKFWVLLLTWFFFFFFFLYRFVGSLVTLLLGTLYVSGISMLPIKYVVLTVRPIVCGPGGKWSFAHHLKNPFYGELNNGPWARGPFIPIQLTECICSQIRSRTGKVSVSPRTREFIHVSCSLQGFLNSSETNIHPGWWLLWRVLTAYDWS